MQLIHDLSQKQNSKLSESNLIPIRQEKSIVLEEEEGKRCERILNNLSDVDWENILQKREFNVCYHLKKAT